jgi:hypothetical protein
MTQKQNHRAIVEKIIPDGAHGPYAVAFSEELGSVTFSLDPGIWLEQEWPERGTYVILSCIRKKRAGWRAHSGRFLTPSDEQTVPIRKQKTEKNKQGAVR